MAVVLAVDPQHVEVGRQALDLAEEVLRGEPALPQLVRQRVRRGRQADAGLDELAQQGRHEHRVAGVVELELVDADEAVALERLDGRAEAERADEVGVLDERPEPLGPGHGMPQGGEQVRLAHAEAAVEVHAGTTLGRCRPPEDRPTGRRLGDARGEGPQRGERRRLRRLARRRAGRCRSCTSAKCGGGTNSSTRSADRQRGVTRGQRLGHDREPIHATISRCVASTPAPRPTSPTTTLRTAYAFPARRPWVRANMVSTLDGTMRGPDGSSRSISTPTDQRVFRAGPSRRRRDPRRRGHDPRRGLPAVRAHGGDRDASPRPAPDPADVRRAHRRARPPDRVHDTMRRPRARPAPCATSSTSSAAATTPSSFPG